MMMTIVQVKYTVLCVFVLVITLYCLPQLVLSYVVLGISRI